jgi:YD repeat-containing protein
MSSAEQQAVLNRMLKSQDKYTKKIEWDSDGNPKYIGEATPGIAEDEIGWRIKYLEWDPDGNPVSITWSGGSREFLSKWSKRGTYTYT